MMSQHPRRRPEHRHERSRNRRKEALIARLEVGIDDLTDPVGVKLSVEEIRQLLMDAKQWVETSS